MKLLVGFLKSCITTVLFLSAFVASADFNVSDLVNADVYTYIDASSQLVIVNHKVRILNKHNLPVKSYIFTVDKRWQRNISHIEASDDSGHSLTINRLPIRNVLKFDIQFYNHLNPGAIDNILISLVVSNYLQSYPKTVKQGEKHLVLFPFNIYYYSEYFTQDQTTLVYLGSSAVNVDGATYNTAEDGSFRGLRFGPYNGLLPMADHESIIHYKNTFPFLTVKMLNRFIRISHWGYLTVWEDIILHHTGPTFHGPFEREPRHESSSDTRIEKFTTTLPTQAFDIYLKDEIGLLSSYDVEYEDDKVQVNIKPRFVMYGGWKTQYEIGYTLPINSFIFYDDQTSYTLRVPVIDKIFKNMIIKQANINVILPEGAVFQSIEPNMHIENKTSERYCYVFDFNCREIVFLKRTNLVDHHSSVIMYVKYSYPQLKMLLKPFYIALLIFGMFLLFLIHQHLFPNMLIPPEQRYTSYQKFTNPKQSTGKVKRKKANYKK